MRASIKNYMEALKRQREERGEDAEGFSLIELIIVVVILGILVAVAIPIFLSIQGTAQENALKAAAANGATAAAAAAAQPGAVAADLTAAAVSAGDGDIVTALTAGTPSDVTSICVSATATGWQGSPISAGPGC